MLDLLLLAAAVVLVYLSTCDTADRDRISVDEQPAFLAFDDPHLDDQLGFEPESLAAGLEEPLQVSPLSTEADDFGEAVA